MDSLRAPEKGEVVRLGPPAAGEVVITVDPATAGATFAAGTQTFLPGAELPVHKHFDRDIVLLVYKGQGRVTLNERIINVVPGAMVRVPKGAWYGVRNTGTGAFQIAWASSPGLEAFFRGLSGLGEAPSPQALQELGQRHGIEFRQPTEAPPAPAGRPRHRRREGRPNRPATPPSFDSASPRSGRHPEQSRGTPSTPPPVPGAPSAAPAPAASSPAGAPRPRRHRRGGRRHAGNRPREQGSTPPRPASSPAAPAPSRPAAPGRRPSARHGRSRRGKDVYINGQWVRAEGDGPMIASNPKHSGRRAPKPGGDDDASGSSLSVLL